MSQPSLSDGEKCNDNNNYNVNDWAAIAVALILESVQRCSRSLKQQQLFDYNAGLMAV